VDKPPDEGNPQAVKEKSLQNLKDTENDQDEGDGLPAVSGS
jgi:hypothetical protein